MSFKLLFLVVVVSAQNGLDWRFSSIENITPLCNTEKEPEKNLLLFEVNGNFFFVNRKGLICVSPVQAYE